MQNNHQLIKKKIRLKEIFDGEIIEISKGWKALSPFKKENDASFKVTENEDGDIWYCFSTKQGGDVFDYYEKINHVESKVAFYELSKLAGLKIDNIYTEIYTNDELLEFESKLIREHAFFVQRGIDKDILIKYGVGYVEDINKLNLKTDVILKYNLSGIKDSIVYLVKDRMGKNIGFYCRPVNPGPNKYIGFSPTQVYGLHQLNNETDYVIIVEGQNDVLGLRTNGINNVLAVSGTNFNAKIFSEFRKSNITKVIFVPDADGGGHSFINNIITNYGTFDTYGISVKYAILPKEGLDPCDYIKVDKTFFESLPEKDPIVSYFEQQTGDNVDRLKNILVNKTYLKAYEVQLALKEILGGLVDINTIHNDLYNKEYEEIFIANILNNRILFDKAKVSVHEDTIVINKQIYKFIIDNEECTVETIKNHFNREFSKHDINAHQIYVDKLEKLREKRDVYQVLSTYSTSILSENISTDNMISSMIHELNQSYVNNNTNSIGIGSALKNAIHDINDGEHNGIEIKDKFPQLDTIIHGLQRGKLVLIGGSSGSGKSTLASNFIDSIAIKQDNKTLVLNGEMTPEECSLRQLTISSGVPFDDIISGRAELNNDIMKPILDGRIEFDSLPPIDETDSYLERQLLANPGLKVIVYDYIQLSIFNGHNLARHEQLSMLTRILKRFAQKHKLVIIGLVQLNGEGVRAEVASLDDTAGAKAMKADADIGITIKRKQPKEGVLSDGNAELNLDKSRFSRDKIIIPVYFKGATSTIYEV